MKEDLLIITPDILPNNLRQIRLMREETTEKIAKALGLNHSYISIIENNKTNMSGISTIRLMNYLDINFYQLYGSEEPMKLPYTIEIPHTLNTTLTVEKELLASEGNEHKIEMLLTDKLIHSNLISKEQKIKTYKLIDTKQEQELNKITAKFEITVIEKNIKETMFDMNFIGEIDNELFEILTKKGFIKHEKINIQKKDFSVDESKIYLKKEYTFAYKENKKKTYSTNTIEIDDENIRIFYDRSNNIKSIELETATECLYNIKYIQEHLGLSQDFIADSLGISKTGYLNLIMGYQKLSTKLMWRLVKLFKVPLETIINIPLYTEKFLNN